MANYIEPGAYSEVISNRSNTGGGTRLIPLIIGSGALTFQTTEAIVRGNDGMTDVLPNDNVTIVRVGVTKNGKEYDGQYDLTSDTSSNESATNNAIKWKTSSGSDTYTVPDAGDTYYVTYYYTLSDTENTELYNEITNIHLITDSNQISKIYGSDLEYSRSDEEEGEATYEQKINRLAAMADIFTETGVNTFYMLHIGCESDDPTIAEKYEDALDKYAKYVDDIWRIVPCDYISGNTINNKILGHIKSCSTYEERKERTLVAPYYTDATTATDLISKLGGYTSGMSYDRVCITYPDKATRYLSDGNLYELDGPFLSALFCAMEASMSIQDSKTRASSTCFEELKGIKMTRGEMNLLAENGVMIFEQKSGAGTPVTCRHQLTTDMSNVETKEASIIAIKDYTSKYLRSICETYIGKYNITPDTISRVKGSVEAGLASLVANNIIISGSLTSIKQDEDNPDTLLIEVSINVPFPCNYIKLTIVVE